MLNVSQRILLTYIASFFPAPGGLVDCDLCLSCHHVVRTGVLRNMRGQQQDLLRRECVSSIFRPPRAPYQAHLAVPGLAGRVKRPIKILFQSLSQSMVVCRYSQFNCQSITLIQHMSNSWNTGAKLYA